MLFRKLTEFAADSSGPGVKIQKMALVPPFNRHLENHSQMMTSYTLMMRYTRF
jgi:hypothetical protein